MAAVERLGLRDERWLELVRDSRAAGPFHEPAWTEAVCACYGFPPFALAVVAADGGVSAGVPAAELGGRLRPRRLVSLPFTDAVAPLARDEAALEQLLSGLRDEGRVELRAAVRAAGWDARPVAVTHTLELADDPERLRRGFHRSQVQRNIARAEREGVTVRSSTAREDLTRVFYDLHARTRRHQGVPVQPRRFFRHLWDRVVEPGLGFVLLAEHGSDAIAGALFLVANGTLTYKFGASDRRRLSLRPNHLIFWTAIRLACERGLEQFDLGRSDFDNDGLRAFKSGWGAREEPLVYSTCGSEQRSSAHSPRALQALIRRGPPWVGRAAGEALYRLAA